MVHSNFLGHFGWLFSLSSFWETVELGQGMALPLNCSKKK